MQVQLKQALGLSVLFIGMLAVLSCSSRPIKLELDDVEVSRERADEDCKELGKVEGRTMTATGSVEEALDDLKKSAAAKGANYVVVKQYSQTGTAVTGLAYECD